MDEVKVVNGSLNEVLGAIDAIQEKHVYPIYIPSLKREVFFKEMNTRQEKMLVKTIVDSPIYNSEFIFAIRTILKENCAEDVDIDSLTIIDKTAICLTMRMKSIGDTFTYTFKDTEKTKDIKISDYVKEFADVEIPADETVGSDDVKILCGYPTIDVEYKLEREFRTNVTNLEVNTLEEARDAIGNVFTNEIVKYIKQITINREDTAMILDMSDYTFKNRITILEKIGNKAVNTVIDYIEKSNKVVRDKLAIELKLDSEDEKLFKTEKLTSVLETGSDFFIIS